MSVRARGRAGGRWPDVRVACARSDGRGCGWAAISHKPAGDQSPRRDGRRCGLAAPLTNPHAPPDPAYMPQDRIPQQAVGQALSAEADAHLDEGRSAAGMADKYERLAVLGAVLFLIGVGSLPGTRGTLGAGRRGGAAPRRISCAIPQPLQTPPDLRSAQRAIPARQMVEVQSARHDRDHCPPGFITWSGAIAYPGPQSHRVRP
jgi:hypothetical protein